MATSFVPSDELATRNHTRGSSRGSHVVPTAWETTDGIEKLGSLFTSLIVMVKLVLIVHVIKTGLNSSWIWIVLIVPIIGPPAYFFVEIWPELNESRTVRGAKRAVGQAINPNKSLREATSNYEYVNTVENSTTLAEECMDKGLFDETKQLNRECLKGVHADDPELLHGHALAEFNLNQFAEARSTLDKLANRNPTFKNANARLLLARTLEELNETELALREYEAMDGYFPGPESTYHHAMLLKKLGDMTESNILIDGIVRAAKISSRHYNSTYKVWIRMAKSELWSREQEQQERPKA